MATITIKATSTRNKSYLNKTFVLTQVEEGKNWFTTKIGKKEYHGKFNDYVYRGEPLTMEEASEKGHGFCFNLVGSSKPGNVWFDRFEIIK